MGWLLDGNGEGGDELLKGPGAVVKMKLVPQHRYSCRTNPAQPHLTVGAALSPYGGTRAVKIHGEDTREIGEMYEFLCVWSRGREMVVLLEELSKYWSSRSSFRGQLGGEGED